jgi:glycosyltransferase involved in cell wall biosynthesis
VSRILWLSNAAWSPSGYGEQTATFVPRLQALGHELAVAANYGLQAAKFEIGGLTTYPADGNWGNTTLGTYAEHHQADFVIALCDAWVLKPHLWPADLRMAIWTPIDHWPIPPSVLAVLQHPQVKPIAMSRFGEEWMHKFKLDPLYVPHGVDTRLFTPHPERRTAVRRELSVPEDAFLVGMVAANKGNPSFPRKGFPQAFDAFAQFAKTHTDAWMYVHSDASGHGGSGIDLDVLARAVNCPQGRVRFPPEKAWQLGMAKEVVANLYHAFDVLLNPSMGEGFGIPIIEAQASGVPVIASDHSAMTELTQAGWLVPGDRWWDALQESFAIVPSIGGIVAALEAAYDSRGDQKLRDAAVEFARDYDADLVTVRDWEPALQKLSKGQEVGPLVTNRAQRRNGQKTKRTKAKSR